MAIEDALAEFKQNLRDSKDKLEPIHEGQLDFRRVFSEVEGNSTKTSAESMINAYRALLDQHRVVFDKVVDLELHVAKLKELGFPGTPSFMLKAEDYAAFAANVRTIELAFKQISAEAEASGGTATFVGDDEN